MSETYLNVNEMIPLAEDLKQIVDSARIADANRLTKKGIWTPGLINPIQPFMTVDSSRLSIPAFRGFTPNGDLIECSNDISGLVISNNLVENGIDNEEISASSTPTWQNFSITSSNIVLDSVGKYYKYTFNPFGEGSMLEGFKFSSTTNTLSVEFYNVTKSFSYGKFDSIQSGVDFVVNLKEAINNDILELRLYSILNLLNLPFEIVAGLEIGLTGYLSVSNHIVNITSSNTNSWAPSSVGENYYYAVVARYNPIFEDNRDGEFIPSTASSFNALEKGSFTLKALRKSGAVMDDFTADDILLGIVTVNWGETAPNITVSSSGSEFFNSVPTLDVFKLNVGTTKDNTGEIADQISILEANYTQLQNIVNNLNLNQTIVISQDFVGCIFPYAGQLSSATVNLKKKVGSTFVDTTTIYYKGSLLFAEGICLPNGLFQVLALKLGTSMGKLDGTVVTPNYTNVFLRGSSSPSQPLNDNLIECTQLPIKGGPLWWSNISQTNAWGCVKLSNGKNHLGSSEADERNYAMEIDSSAQTRVVGGVSVPDTRYNGTTVAPNHKTIYLMIETGVDIASVLSQLQ